MAKKNYESLKEIAKSLYMSGMQQKEIADRIGVSAVTVNKWVNEGGWKEFRAAKNITRPELVNKLLVAINKLLDQVAESDDPVALAGLSDKLAKFASVIEKLDKKANVVDAIEVFMAFNKWIQYRQTFDSELTPELIKAINKYQDIYITEQISK